MGKPDIVNPCSSCQGEVSPPFLCCKKCGLKVHNKQTCSGVAPRLASHLVGYTGDSIFFHCLSCKALQGVPNDGEMKQTMQTLSMSVQRLSSLVEQQMEWKASLLPDLKDLKDSVSELLRWRESFEEVRQVATSPQLTRDEVRDIARSELATFAREELRAIARDEFGSIARDELVELRERDKRRDSVVIRGLDYVNDLEFQALFDQLTLALVNKKIELSGITQLNPRFIRARVLNRDDRVLLLSSTSALRTMSRFSSVYISRDLTYKQREDLRNRRLGGNQQSSNTPATGANSVPLVGSSVVPSQVPNRAVSDRRVVSSFKPVTLSNAGSVPLTSSSGSMIPRSSPLSSTSQSQGPANAAITPTPAARRSIGSRTTPSPLAAAAVSTSPHPLHSPPILPARSPSFVSTLRFNTPVSGAHRSDNPSEINPAVSNIEPIPPNSPNLF